MSEVPTSAIETTLGFITFACSIICLLITAGPMSRYPFFPHRAFMYLLTVTLMGASLYHLIKMFGEGEAVAKAYAQTIIALARFGMFVIGALALTTWRDRCRRLAEKDK